ncbi:MAG: hypothetical protein J6U54_02210, partial [Clostridiales bacterium]|nr:hypothetical protein [Clostridiales bacterium]
MKYYGVEHYGNALAHRAKYGTADSTSNEKGADNKKNNTSEYNHDYYMRNKSKWQDNDSGSSSSGSKESDEDKASDEDKEFDVDAAARDVIRGMYGNGAERKAALGDDY